jgi:acetyltransferase-like isoleucine patch superfamily enzyme
MKMVSKFRKGLSHPTKAWAAVRGRAKGHIYKVWCRLSRRRFRAGKNLIIDGRLIVRGPGQVILGDNVRIGMTVTPWTHSAEAVIEIGDDVFLNGTQFGCQRKIHVGNRCILAKCNLIDTDFHSTSVNRHDPDAPIRVAPIWLDDNVWVAAQVGILPGVRVGENSVVGFGAVCTGTYPANVIIAGNPATVVRALETPPHDRVAVAGGLIGKELAEG